MKSTGIVRKVDNLGRVVLPIELRRVLGIGLKDPIEIFTEGDMVVLRKYNPGCTLCGSNDNVKYYGSNKETPLCNGCAEGIARDVIHDHKAKAAG